MAADDQANGAGPASPNNARQPQKFDPAKLDKALLAGELVEALSSQSSTDPIDVIIDLNLEFIEGRDAAKRWVENWIKQHLQLLSAAQRQAENFDSLKTEYSQQYVYATLSAETLRDLVQASSDFVRTYIKARVTEKNTSPIYKIWLDHDLTSFMNVSICTVKADAARAAFGSDGKGIVWAVADSGIDASHPHFALHKNLKDLPSPLNHRDFTKAGSHDGKGAVNSALLDRFGHGTHVAGIIAGEIPVQQKSLKRKRALTAPSDSAARVQDDASIEMRAFYREKDDSDDVKTRVATLQSISGMAPRCKLLSLKVLDENGVGKASNLIAAIEYIQHLNGNGRRIRVHGLNVSVGYSFKPEWFACGQSPLCVEIDRLVRSGVSVVVAAGNDGYGFVQTENSSGAAAGLSVTIADPGNSDLAITVGSTHREMPHTYGVSYFSSKGPTGDGRLKPDLLAPGEKIISCMSAEINFANLKLDQNVINDTLAKSPTKIAAYREDSGTSMAAPHISGVIAAFLSNRREFIGRPEVVKELFMSSASDLKRSPYFQGKGLVDLMRTIQSI